MEKKKLSIITLTYNNWRELKPAIESVGRQNISEEYEVEYLIVDDGTSDLDTDYIYSLLNENISFPCRVITNSHNKGTVKSFNDAIKSCNGDFIIILSADDEFYDENVINSVAAVFEDINVNVLTAKRVPITDGVEDFPLPTPEQESLFSDDKALLNHLIKYGSCISGACTYYRKSFLVSQGYFDEGYRLLEDYPFYVKVLLSGNRIDFINICSIKYHTGGVSAVGNRNKLLTEDFKKLYTWISSLDELSFYWKRKLYYRKVLTAKEKITFENLIRYPEQFLLLCIDKFISFLRKYKV